MIETYPTPNEFGSYAKDVGTSKVFEHSIRHSRCRLIVVQVGPEKYAAGADLEYGCGNFSGEFRGPSDSETFGSFDEALDCMIERAKRHFLPASLHPCDSCVTSEQREIAEQFTALLERGWPRIVSAPAQLSLFAA